MVADNFPLIQVDETTWEIPKTYKPEMKVPARVVATKSLLKTIDEAVIEQITNVACLPGVVGDVWAMPDAHSGYGAPIGAVFATDPEVDGVISPGAVGYDINCGVRLIRTDLTLKDVRPRLSQIIDRFFVVVPAGVGALGALKLRRAEFKQLLKKGVGWCLDQGLGWAEDQERCEEKGCLAGADPDKVSDRAFRRGIDQVGTLGAGNHYLEIQAVDRIFDDRLAEQFGIFSQDQVVLMIHCGSRGLGHQVASDYLRRFEKAMTKYRIAVPDKQLACAPLRSPEGGDYRAAMAAAVNMAFANRQLITYFTREVFAKVFGQPSDKLGMSLVYDVAHNIAKLEEHQFVVNNKVMLKKVLVHRKGATRAFAAGRVELPSIYQEIGQPVLIGGSMETGSYLLLGLDGAMIKAFGSTAHGSGRIMSRAAAKRQITGEELSQRMRQKGIYIKSASIRGLAEEAGFAYKDIDEVIKAVEQAGISKPVARLKPVGNLKG